MNEHNFDVVTGRHPVVARHDELKEVARRATFRRLALQQASEPAQAVHDVREAAAHWLRSRGQHRAFREMLEIILALQRPVARLEAPAPTDAGTP
jgi:3-deoxy-D-manno-octulosonate 8-phosphate phosphatase KdsC-like HAD superfamily phosphatase